MKVLITGSAGFIGGYMSSSLDRYYDVMPTDSRVSNQKLSNFRFLDILETEQIKEVLSYFNPDAILHLAGVKDLNFCETKRDDTYNINVIGTKNLVDACCASKCKMIFLSTDYVFDGEKGMYTEEDLVNPKTYYGVTKLDAENLIRDRMKNYVIIRTGGVFGSYNSIISPLFSWLIENLKAGKTVDAYTDIYNTPTSLKLLGDAMRNIIKIENTGLFHVAGHERINRFDFFRKVAGHYGFDPNLIRPSTSHGSEQSFLRPRDISLDTTKSYKLLKIKKSGKLIV